MHCPQEQKQQYFGECAVEEAISAKAQARCKALTQQVTCSAGHHKSLSMTTVLQPASSVSRITARKVYNPI